MLSIVKEESTINDSISCGQMDKSPADSQKWNSKSWLRKELEALRKHKREQLQRLKIKRVSVVINEENRELCLNKNLALFLLFLFS